MFIAATLVRILRKEITVGLDAWTREEEEEEEEEFIYHKVITRLDGVGCMSQHGVGTGLEMNSAGTGGDGDH